MPAISPAADAVQTALAELGQASAADLRDKTGKARSTVDKAIRELAESGLIAEGEPDPANGTTRWQPVIPDATDTVEASSDEAPTIVDQAGSDDDTPVAETGRDDEMSADGATTTTDAVPSSVTPPPRPADRKVLIVAGILGDYPDGATLDVISEASGLGLSTVVRLLTAMEQADAARRLTTSDSDGPERWIAGDGKASAVDPNPAPQRCPTCGQTIRLGRPRPAGDRDAIRNADGSEPLARNVLRGWVLEFLKAHHGQAFTPQDIATRLSTTHGRTISNGAIRNNCTALAASGLIQLATETPLAFTANGTDQTS